MFSVDKQLESGLFIRSCESWMMPAVPGLKMSNRVYRDLTWVRVNSCGINPPF